LKKSRNAPLAKCMVENRCIYARASLKNTKDGVELINSFTLSVIGVACESENDKEKEK